MSSWHSYPSIFNIGHKILEGYMDGCVQVEEKIDGSQLSWGVFDDELKIRSKGVELNIEAPEKMFSKAVDVIKLLKPILHNGWTYRGEYLSKSKHNTLSYERIPKNHLIIFDINNGEESYMSYEDKKHEAERLQLEVVPLLYSGILTQDKLQELMNIESVLGGQKIEGVVIKRYDLFGKDKKVLLAKHVSEAFKEKHKTEWKNTNPGSGDIIDNLVKIYKHENRWLKAVQHLKENGLLTDSPKDIPLLIKEIKADILKEEEENIKKLLWEWGSDKILRGSTNGAAEWYKNLLMSKQFE